MSFVLFLLSSFVSIVIGAFTIYFYKKNKWIDDPKKNKHIKTTHTKPVPRGGGFVVGLTILIVSIIFLNIDKYIIAILISTIILILVGFLDDLFDIHPLIRLFIGFFVASIVVFSGLNINYIAHPFNSQIINLNLPINLNNLKILDLSNILTILYIVWTMNIINWSKGVDGQLPGFTTITLLILALTQGQFADKITEFNITYLTFITAGAFLGLLFWNWEPQTMMPGYGAGSLAGFMLAVLSILNGMKFTTTIMVLAIPMADGVFTIVRRIVHKKMPFWGDRGHLHHKLFDVYKFSKSQIAIFYILTSLILGLLSFVLQIKQKLVITNIIFISVFLFFIITKKLYKNNDEKTKTNNKNTKTNSMD